MVEITSAGSITPRLPDETDPCTIAVMESMFSVGLVSQTSTVGLPAELVGVTVLGLGMSLILFYSV